MRKNRSSVPVAMVLSCMPVAACGAGEQHDELEQSDVTRRQVQPICMEDDIECQNRGTSDDTGGGGQPPVYGEACNRMVAGWIAASPQSIAQGQASAVSWSVSFPNCSVTGQLTLNDQPVSATGSRSVTPLSTQTYALKLGARTLATANLDVALPATVRIRGNTVEWRDLFIQAIATENRTVLLQDGVDLDLTGLSELWIAAGVTVAGEAPQLLYAPLSASSASTASSVTSTALASPSTTQNASRTSGVFAPYQVARRGLNLGPRLFTNSRPYYLFNLGGDNIRLEGFRFQGPDMGLTSGEARGIVINSKVGIEITNLEVSGWSHSAIYIKDPGDVMHNPDAVKIRRSFFHHNQHVPGGLGYGIDVVDKAYALIENNVFDFNRHAISAGGVDGTGYKAHQNLVLRGGGHHCPDNPGPNIPICGHTHMFDVHGTDNCGITGFFSDSQWNCGTGGQQFWITENAFQYTGDNAFKLRGTPTIAAYVFNNVFAHDDLDDAVHQNGSGLEFGLPYQANTVGVDTYGEYGVCDFDGDRRDDLFLATGASFWYSSAGKMHWTFLAPYRERLHQVGLGDFNADGRCDVLAANGDTWEIASGGSGAWQALGTYPGVQFSELRFHDFNADGRTDVFWRAPNGQWSVISPGVHGWRALQSSSYPLSKLRFGDFNGDGVTDVLSPANGALSVSDSGLGSWRRLNSMPPMTDLASLYIGNVDGIPGDDLVRYLVTSPTSGKWEVSSGGSGLWQVLTQVTNLTAPNTAADLASSMLTFVGKFDQWSGSDLLVIDHNRQSRLFSKGHADLAGYGLYAY